MELEKGKERFREVKESDNREEMINILKKIKESLLKKEMEKANNFIDRLLENYPFLRAPTFKGELKGDEPIVKNAKPRIENIIKKLKSGNE